MQLTSFWPPRRTLDRARAELYRRGNADRPWVGRDAVKLLDDLVKPADRCLEWGSGSSTVWLSRKAGTVLSAEHDPVWFERVNAELQREGLSRGSVRLLSTAPVAEPNASPYVRVIDEFGEGELDFCFVDGEHRAPCALAAVPKLSCGGVLVIDDVHSRLDHPTTSAGSREGRGPTDGEWARFTDLVSGWRHVWTSDGFSDTAFWIKP
ncbi:MAG: class I SAM-dependent methyltransferase [Solirubrobacteraceae bacterium]